MGYRPDAIEAQLAHADQNNVRRTYNHATYFDERRTMMQEWADKLDEWKGKHEAEQNIKRWACLSPPRSN